MNALVGARETDLVGVILDALVANGGADSAERDRLWLAAATCVAAALANRLGDNAATFAEFAGWSHAVVGANPPPGGPLGPRAGGEP